MIAVTLEGKHSLLRDSETKWSWKGFFKIDPPGGNLKVKTSGGDQNIWPDSASKFSWQPECYTAILVAMHCDRQDILREPENAFSSDNSEDYQLFL